MPEEVTRLLAIVSMGVIGVSPFTLNALLTCTIQGKRAAGASAVIVLAFIRFGG